MEYKLRPGMIMLTWTSMNIDAYKSHIHAGLRKLEELVVNINDIIENRIEKNLKMVCLFDSALLCILYYILLFFLLLFFPLLKCT